MVTGSAGRRGYSTTNEKPRSAVTTAASRIRASWQKFWSLSWWWKGSILAILASLALVGVVSAVGGGGDSEDDKLLALTPDIEATETASAAGRADATATAEAESVAATATAIAFAPFATATAEAEAIDATATAEAFAPHATATAEAERLAAIGKSRDNPVPFGQPHTVPEGWEVTVVDFTSDATALVLQENQFNDPPVPGARFLMVRIRGTNISAGNPADFSPAFNFRLVGSRNVPYSTFENSCGVVPDDFLLANSEAFEGGTVEGNLCYEVGADETGFVLFTEFLETFSDQDRRWFALQ